MSPNPKIPWKTLPSLQLLSPGGVGGQTLGPKESHELREGSRAPPKTRAQRWSTGRK